MKSKGRYRPTEYKKEYIDCRFGHRTPVGLTTLVTLKVLTYYNGTVVFCLPLIREQKIH